MLSVTSANGSSPFMAKEAEAENRLNIWKASSDGLEWQCNNFIPDQLVGRPKRVARGDTGSFIAFFFFF